MIVKQTYNRFSVFVGSLVVMSLFMALNSAPIASADPATTQVTCKDGTAVTAKIDAAQPNDILNDKDFKEVCKSHDGYEAPVAPPASTTSTCGGADTAIIKCDADNSGDITNNGIWALLLMTINILTAGIGIAAVGGIIYGSVLYATAGDSEGQITQAKEVIRNVVIGIILYVAMYAILQFIIPGGVFTS